MRVPVATCAALAVAVPLSGAAASTPRSGLHGVVMRGPLPACRNEEPCEAPARGVVLQFTRAGKSVRVRTTQKGTYRVMLQPATYAVTTVPRSRIGTGLTPHSVRVSRGRIARRDFHLDTGLQ